MINCESTVRNTYEQWMEEAIRHIPVYTKEWTNFNASDPGITILENLTAFQTLQQETMFTMSEEVKEQMLNLIGFDKRLEHCAKVLLTYNQNKSFLPHQKFYAGSICFETLKEVDAIKEDNVLIDNTQDFHFSVINRKTKSIVLTYPLNTRIEIKDAMVEHNYVNCFCKEGTVFYKYELKQANQTNQENGRFYSIKQIDWGVRELYFPNLLHSNSVQKICCVLSDEETMIHQKLGTVIGYDNQEISLVPFAGVLKEDFCILTKIKGKLEDEYQFFEPNDTTEGGLRYVLNSNEQLIVITDPGDYEGAELFLVGCVLFDGEEGNIRANNEFKTIINNETIVLRNTSAGVLGRRQENIEERMKRFTKEMQNPVSLVTKNDYETFIRQIPDLRIHKVNCYTKKGVETIFIVVKPYDAEFLPKLSPLYKKVIMKALEEKRLLCTKIQLLQPTYTSIHVSGTIYVKEYYKNFKTQIEDTIVGLLDYVNTDKRFGETISFYEIYSTIEKLECVEEIFDLSIMPENKNLVKINGLDLELATNCLCYAGDILIEYYT